MGVGFTLEQWLKKYRPGYLSGKFGYPYPGSEATGFYPESEHITPTVPFIDPHPAFRARTTPITEKERRESYNRNYAKLIPGYDPRAQKILTEWVMPAAALSGFGGAGKYAWEAAARLPIVPRVAARAAVSPLAAFDVASERIGTGARRLWMSILERQGRPTNPIITRQKQLNTWEKKFRAANKLIDKGEMPPEQGIPVSQEASLNMSWREFSEARGYTPKQINEFENYLRLAQDGQELGLSIDDLAAISFDVKQGNPSTPWTTKEVANILQRGSTTMGGLAEEQTPRAIMPIQSAKEYTKLGYQKQVQADKAVGIPEARWGKPYAQKTPEERALLAAGEPGLKNVPATAAIPEEVAYKVPHGEPVPIRELAKNPEVQKLFPDLERDVATYDYTVAKLKKYADISDPKHPRFRELARGATDKAGLEKTMQVIAKRLQQEHPELAFRPVGDKGTAVAYAITDDAGKQVGLLSITEVKGHRVLEEIVLEESAQRQGLGTKVLLEALAKEPTKPIIASEVVPEGRAFLIGLRDKGLVALNQVKEKTLRDLQTVPDIHPEFEIKLTIPKITAQVAQVAKATKAEQLEAFVRSGLGEMPQNIAYYKAPGSQAGIIKWHGKLYQMHPTTGINAGHLGELRGFGKIKNINRVGENHRWAKLYNSPTERKKLPIFGERAKMPDLKALPEPKPVVSAPEVAAKPAPVEAPSQAQEILEALGATETPKPKVPGKPAVTPKPAAVVPDEDFLATLLNDMDEGSVTKILKVTKQTKGGAPPKKPPIKPPVGKAPPPPPNPEGAMSAGRASEYWNTLSNAERPSLGKTLGFTTKHLSRKGWSAITPEERALIANLPKSPEYGIMIKPTRTGRIPTKMVYLDGKIREIPYAIRGFAKDNPQKFLETEDLVDKMIRAMEVAKKLNRKQIEELAAAQRAKALAAFGEVLGSTGEITNSMVGRAMARLKGELPAGHFEPLREFFTPEQVAKLRGRIGLAKLTEGQQATTLDGFEAVFGRFTKDLPKGYQEGILPGRSRINALNNVYGLRFAKALLGKRGNWAKGWEIFQDVINLPKSVKSSWDFSAPLRQGAILHISHPEIAFRAYKPMFKSWWSEDQLAIVDDAIRENPFFDLGQRGKLFIQDIRGLTTSVLEREEAFISSYAKHIPLVRRSERAYVSFLNKLRQDTFSYYMKQWGAHPIGKGRYFYGKGKTFNDIKALANYINAATGRGDLGFLNSSSGALNAIFFSPRLQFSRVVLPFIPIFSSSPAVRKIAAKDLAKFVAAGITALVLLKQSGVATVETDPRSTDFLKARVGNRRYDFWAGFQPYARVVAQVVLSQRKTASGRIQREPQVNRWELLDRFRMTKRAPVAGLFEDLLKGENFLGEEITFEDMSWLNEVLETLAPLAVDDIIEASIEEGLVGGIATAPAAMFGVGVQTYDSSAQIVGEVYGANTNYRDLQAKLRGYVEDGKLNQAKKLIAKYPQAQLYYDKGQNQIFSKTAQELGQATRVLDLRKKEMEYIKRVVGISEEDRERFVTELQIIQQELSIEIMLRLDRLEAQAREQAKQRKQK